MQAHHDQLSHFPRAAHPPALSLGSLHRSLAISLMLTVFPKAAWYSLAERETTISHTVGAHCTALPKDGSQSGDSTPSMINRFISEMPVRKQPIANRASGVDQGSAGLESCIILTL